MDMNKFRTDASFYISKAIMADGMGGYGFAIKNYEEGVRNLDAAIMHCADEKMRSIWTSQRETVTKRLNAVISLKKQSKMVGK